MSTKDLAARALEALERDEKVLLSYFCEWLVLNAAIAKSGRPSPIESVSAIGTDVQRFLYRMLPDHDFNVRHAIYLEMTLVAWNLRYPQRFFQLEPTFSASLDEEAGVQPERPSA